MVKKSVPPTNNRSLLSPTFLSSFFFFRLNSSTARLCRGEIIRFYPVIISSTIGITQHGFIVNKSKTFSPKSIYANIIEGLFTWLSTLQTVNPNCQLVQEIRPVPPDYHIQSEMTSLLGCFRVQKFYKNT